MFDEVQTGVGITGKLWAHQHFDLETPPDMMVFGKKMRLGGFFANERSSIAQFGRMYQTRNGDRAQAMLSRATLPHDRSPRVCSRTLRAVGDVFLAGLEALAEKHPALVSDARGRGLLLAFDMPTPDVRNRFLEAALAKGVFASYTGSRSVRLRPHLITTEEDVRTALSVFDATLRELNLSRCFEPSRRKICTHLARPTVCRRSTCVRCSVVAEVLPFRVNRYVVEELIDWDRVPEDPIFQLTFPQEGMLEPEHFSKMADTLRAGGDVSCARSQTRFAEALNPHPGDQLALNRPIVDGSPVPGVQRKYRETVLVFPAQGQTCHAYCTYCFRWPQFVMKDLKFANAEVERFTDFIGREKAADRRPRDRR